MSGPRVTVLMSVYNGGPYLREAVESILRQSFSDFEFLIIDDGSQDDSVAIVEAYKEPRIRLIRNGGNLGLSLSLNKGLELARGEYVARMDADDISRPERLALQVAFLDAHPQVGVCGSWVRFFPKAQGALWKLPPSSEQIRCWQFHTVGVAHPAVMLRRRFFAEHGLIYDPLCRYAQDFELWGRAIRYMEFANIQRVLLDYRLSPGQVGAAHGPEQLATVTPLRLERVRELGLEPTQEQQHWHEMIMNGGLPAESASLDRAEQWLVQLESANRALGNYPADCFSRRLLDIWFSACLSIAGAPGCTLSRCLNSPLWSTVPWGAWHRIRAVAAWLAHRRAWEAMRGQRHG